MIIVKKTAVLSPRGAHGLSGVARFECFKEKSDVKVNLAGGRKDLYAVVAVGDEKRVVKLGADRIYLARTDLSGDCAAIVADGEKRVLCAGATVCGYDYTPLEEFLQSAIGEDRARASAVEVADVAQAVANKEQTAEATAQTTAEKAAKQAVKQQDIAEQTSEPQDVTDKTHEEKELAVMQEEQETAKEEENPLQVEQIIQEEKKEEDKKQEEETQKKIDGDVEKTRFFDKIADKIKELFRQNEKDEELTALIPDSRWVRVRTDDGWYVVGIVGEPAEFICYGIPADNPSNPPDEDEGCRQWLDVGRGGRGYWMMYQSAESGETLTAI